MKRRLLALLITAALVLAMFPCTALALDNWDGTVDTSWYNGSASYTISTAEQLAGLARLVNQGAAESGDAPVNFSGITITLGDDIDLAGYDWVPIGAWVWGSLVGRNPFSGTFNGNGHTISNMTVNDPSKVGVGLFGYTTGATIEGLGVTNCDVTGEAVAGGIAGFAEDNSSIYNCYTTGTVKVVYYDSEIGYDGRYAGGLVGIYGESPSTIDGCWSSADVDGEDGRIGGLVGGCVLGRIVNSYATGNVGSPTGAYSAGGFIGTCDQTVIEHCYATGSVTGTGNDGGFIGSTFSNGDNNQFTNCYARGNVTACYTDPTDGSWGWASGGFIGSIADTDIANCYSTGYISYAPAVDAYYIGGFAGELDENFTFTNCFVDTQAAGRAAVGNGDDGTSAAYAGITGLTTANMQGYDALVNSAKADGLDSGAGASVWYAHSGASYPDFDPDNCVINFDNQGATTPASPSTVNAIVGFPVSAMPTDPSRTDFDFGGWWTSTLGLGTEFTDSTPAPGDMTVYALWTNESSSSVYEGARITLAPVGPSGGTWSYDDDYVTLEDLGDGTVRITGVAAGTTQVIYLTSETVEIFDITILDSGLPSTGQDDTLMYLLVSSALLLLSAGTVTWIFSLRRREKRA